MMEKYGVTDAAAQQRIELDRVKDRIAALEGDLEKTGAVTPELEEMRERKRALEEALADQ